MLPRSSGSMASSPKRDALVRFPNTKVPKDIRLYPGSPRVEKRVKCLVPYCDPDAMYAEILKVNDSLENRGYLAGLANTINMKWITKEPPTLFFNGILTNSQLFCAFIKVPLQPYSLNWAMRLFFTDFTFSFCGWTTPLTPMQSKTIPPKTEGLIRPCPQTVYKQDPQAKKQQR